jgi:radical SAM superfamily enzyme YgiQ (UPF0313 family)
MKKSFHVVLISPYSHPFSMGLRILSSCLKGSGWDSRMIYLPDLAELLSFPVPHPQDYPADVLEQVCELCAGANLVGIGVMSNYVGRARALTQAIHRRLSIPVIWGGIHPTVRPAECLNWADFVCVGEGEEVLVELVDQLSNGQKTPSLANIWQKNQQGEAVSAALRPLQSSLDDIPLPDYELSTQYILHQGKIVPATSRLLRYSMANYFANTPQVLHMTSMTRGCPHECTYCCENALGKLYPNWRKLRRRSPENLVAEVKMVRSVIPEIQAVMFSDNTFLATTVEEIRHFSEVYRAEVGLPFFILSTPGAITEEKLSCLLAAGLQDVEMGIQTGNQRMRRLFKRPESNEQVLKAAFCLDRLRDQVPHPRYDLLTDIPYETESDRLETLRLLFLLPSNSDFHFYSLVFYPGTDLYRQARADGLVRNDEEDVYPKNYGQLQSNYYNFVLWCFHRRWPRILLQQLIRPSLYRLFDSVLFKGFFNIFWKILNKLRERRARQIYARFQESL